MKYYYDLHLHTALSPCGDNDMTPNNVVNMAYILELDIIAITDHNSIANVSACIEVCKNNGYDMIILPGMELETAEEIHVVCLFPDIKLLEGFNEIVSNRMNMIENNEKIFGEQIILNSQDEEVGRIENLLITSTNIDIYEAITLCKEYGGIGIPAHIDRHSNSVVSNLGFIPDNLDISLVEFSRNADPQNFLDNMINISNIDYKYIVSSDSHYLDQMMDKNNYFELKENIDSYDVINHLKSL